MGVCQSDMRPLQDVFIPFPSTLESFQTFGHDNLLKCLHVLANRAKREKGKQGPQQLMGPYAIHMRGSPATSDLVISEPGPEVIRLLQDYSTLGKSTASNDKKVTPDSAEGETQLKSRIYCALLRARPILLHENMKFTGELDIVRLNLLVKTPFKRNELRRLIKTFVELDTSGNGLLSPDELATWFEKDYPGIFSCLFFQFIFKLVKCESEEGACAEEFFAIVNHLCTMNEEELTRHAFDCLVDGEDAFKDKYCNMAYLKDRFPCLEDSDRNLENKTFMKEIGSLVDSRKKSWEEGLFERQGYFLRFNDFVEIKRRSQYMLHSLFFSQSFVRKKLFGAHFWREREVVIRAAEGQRLADPERRKSIALKYYAEARVTSAVKQLPYEMVALTEDETKPRRGTGSSAAGTGNMKKFTSKAVSSGASTARRPSISGGGAPTTARRQSLASTIPGTGGMTVGGERPARRPSLAGPSDARRPSGPGIAEEGAPRTRRTSLSSTLGKSLRGQAMGVIASSAFSQSRRLSDIGDAKSSVAVSET